MKYTVESYAKKFNLTRQSAINRLSRLKKQNLVSVSGGGKQKRIYTLHTLPKNPTNGFYDTVNKYSPEKLVPKFDHYIHGRYPIERAIVDGIKIGDVRTLEATMYLFNHVKSWKLLFDLADKKNFRENVLNLYKKARTVTRCRKMPKRYLE